MKNNYTLIIQDEKGKEIVKIDKNTFESKKDPSGKILNEVRDFLSKILNYIGFRERLELGLTLARTFNIPQNANISTLLDDWKSALYNKSLQKDLMIMELSTRILLDRCRNELSDLDLETYTSDYWKKQMALGSLSDAKPSFPAEKYGTFGEKL